MNSITAQLRLAVLAAALALGLAPLTGRGAETNRPPLSPANNATLPAKARAAALAIQRQSWEQGVLAVAFVEEGDDEMVVQMAKASMIHMSRDGIPAASGGATADPLMAGEAILRAAKITGDPTLGKAVTNMLDFALKTGARAADGTLFHTGRQIWSDSFHTSPPFLAAAGHYDEAILQIEGHWKRLWNPDKKLLAHIWDEQGQRFQDRSFWGGGQGWAAAALARVIRALPENRSSDKAKLAGHLKDLIDGCLAHQTRAACSATSWTIQIHSRRPTLPKCSPTQFTKAPAADGSRPITSPPPTGCARRRGRKLTPMALSRASAARPISPAPASPPRARPSS